LEANGSIRGILLEGETDGGTAGEGRQGSESGECPDAAASCGVAGKEEQFGKQRT
jgi:hypothetical protein